MKQLAYSLMAVMIAAAAFVALPGDARSQAGTGSGSASEPAGIGEKGTGQTTSAMER
jgi:hypothetical protein